MPHRYNNEHGPLRLRLSKFVQNGFRYAATDLSPVSASGSKEKPEWMAIYDLTDTSELQKAEYLTLRNAPIQSQRERDLRPYLTIDRRSYDLKQTWQDPSFTPLETIAHDAPQENVLLALNAHFHDPAGAAEYEKWYADEHVAMLAKVPGWRRSRLFTRSAQDAQEEVDYLALHEYAAENGLGGPAHKAVGETAWARRMHGEVQKSRVRREYKLHYTFGAAPRDLAPLGEEGVEGFESTATLTRTLPRRGGGGAIESYVSTADGAKLQYRLEGSADPTAPVVVLVNSILVDYGIWDAFVASFTKQNPQYRVLRYLARGRTSAFGSRRPITVELLASDIIALLDALRIPQAAAAVGVSLGGATVLCAGLTYPERVARFLSCDTSAKSPAGNAKAWGERIEMAEKEGAMSSTASEEEEKRTIVGGDLAEITVRRWFVKESYDGGKQEEVCERVKQMVANNDLEGFKASVQALWEYDLTPKMAGFSGKGAFLVGAQDGVLPKSMAEMARSLGKDGAGITVVEGAGHLPMVEKPGEVVKAVEKLLAM